jgi:hypothetical protein
VPLVLMVKGVEVLGTASIYELETQQARRLIPPTRKFSEQITFTISAAHKNKLRIATVEMRVSLSESKLPLAQSKFTVLQFIRQTLRPRIRFHVAVRIGRY